VLSLLLLLLVLGATGAHFGYRAYRTASIAMDWRDQIKYQLIEEGLPLARAAVERGLAGVRLAGRFQRLTDPRGFQWVLDVAHNEDSARTLAANLRQWAVSGRTLAVCGMLADKDVGQVAGLLGDVVDRWYAASTDGPRGLAAAELAARAAGAGVTMDPAGGVVTALEAAAAAARPGDRVVVFGSFHTVGPALRHLAATGRAPSSAWL